MTDSPPLRMDVGDMEFNPMVGARLEVLLNGVPRTHVLSYDCQARTLTRYATDEQGGLIIDREMDKLVTETLTGDVAARFKD